MKNRKCPHTSLISLTNSGACVFACPMCYARAYAWSEPEKIRIYKNLPEKLEVEIKRLRIAFPFYLSQITDPLQPVHEIRNFTYRVIKILISYHLSFRVVTKCAEGVREMIQNIPELISYPEWFLEMTIESTPEKQVVTSPFASKIVDRISVLKFLNDIGVEAVCRTDPTILGLIEPYDLLWLLERIKDSGVQHIIASTGYYNKSSMENLINRMKMTKFKDRIPKVIEYYNYDPSSTRKRFSAPIELRKKFHKWFREKVEEFGLKYAVCQELPKDYDSKDLISCEGSRRNPVHIRDEKGNFVPIGCAGDCLRYCPDMENPPCGAPVLRTEYPYREKTIQIHTSLFPNFM
uniref:Radical SAM protein n=1 Tax=candidate division WOR-3 bacterium TaxID=2052148 RepID=A0A7V3VUZ3_UNCW3